MNLDTLEALAKAALNETAPYVRAIAIDEYRQATYPETILALIALTREMGEALEWVDHNAVGWCSELKGGSVKEALAKYKEMTNGN